MIAVQRPAVTTGDGLPAQLKERMKLLFVCAGNTCRSPLAEKIAVREARDRGIGRIEVHSAGTDAYDRLATEDTQRVAREHGLDLSQHRARWLTHELIADADLILVMTQQQLQDGLLRDCPKAHLLTTFAGVPGSIEDPIGRGIDAYRAAYDQLEDAISRAFDHFAEEVERRKG
jgi:protein-tyrosine-phosphatase